MEKVEMSYGKKKKKKLRYFGYSFISTLGNSQIILPDNNAAMCIDAQIQQ